MQDKMMKVAQWSVGQVGFGFELVRKEQVEAIGATVYTMRHVKTGAQLLYSSRPCDNKTFAIAFQTLPENHTGVFHILEHSVLCGSKKYPVKEPFVMLLQSSMQTFLNAITFNDKTVYPVSSRNEQDFRNLMSVYLDAVLNPNIYDKPEIFKQEGWHFESESADAVPTYNGVVFSEMKGAFSSVDRMMREETHGLLFPDTVYHFCSGGNPKYIPDLTYEEFINAHKRFYHPSNARIFLDGDMDVEAALEFIDSQYLSGYERREKDFGISLQTPVANRKQVAYQVASAEDTSAHLVLSKILCKFDEYEKIYAAHALCDYLTGSNEAPLQRAVLAANLAQEATAAVNGGNYQPYVTFKVRNTTADKFDAICETVRSTVAKLVEEGLDKKALLASVEQLAFRSQEIREPYGMNLGLSALESWLYDGDPTAHWNTAPIFESLRKKLEGDYFQQLLQEIFGDVDAMCRLEMLPSVTKSQEDAALEQQRLQAIHAAWDAEKRQQVLEQTRYLKAWQKTTDTPEDKAKMPVLSLSDLPEKPVNVQTCQTQIAGCDGLMVQLDTHGINYVNLYFSLADFTQQQLQMVKVMSLLLGKLSTAKLPAAQLQNEVKTWLGAFRASMEVVAKNGEVDKATPYLVISGSMLAENADKALNVMAEILTGTGYTESARVEETLKQSRYAMQQAIISSGNAYAMTKSLAPFSVEGALNEALAGESFVTWLDQLIGQDMAETLQQLQQLHQQIFCKARLTLGYAGASAQQLEALLQKLEQGSMGEAASYSPAAEKVSTVEIPSRVNYCGLGHNLYAMGQEYSGSAVVLGALMSYSYLWNAVRVQGGAYGTGMNVRPNGDLTCHSYRDPNPENTFRVFRAMAETLEQLCKSDASLDSVIIGTVGKSEPLTAPAQACHQALVKHLKGLTYEDACRIHKQMVNTTKEDLLKLIPVLQNMADSGAVCVVGGKDNISFLKQ